MNFEDLQKSWQNQPINVNTDLLKSTLQTKWQQYQRKLFFRIILSSIGLFIAMVGIGWVYLSFHQEFGWPFTLSIAVMYTLMLVYVCAYWKSYAFKKENLGTSSGTYISYQLKKLNWQRKIITLYNWVYLALLWLALVLYLWEVTRSGTLIFRWTALLVITAYLFSVSLWNRFKKQKKQLIEIDEIITDLQHMKSQLID
ncbi:hypothetical protein H7F33_03770 [Pedobacter sp. PAMC26386]|nr:hypothetical protein H7F33_03770 [Pedobacter sp. PAMC26386]